MGKEIHQTVKGINKVLNCKCFFELINTPLPHPELAIFDKGNKPQIIKTRLAVEENSPTD